MVDSGEFQPPREVTVDTGHQGQRIDNFLTTHLKGVPRVRIYRIIRRGEVRVNKGRIRQGYRLQTGDVVRIPPLRWRADDRPPPPGEGALKHIAASISYEDDGLIVLNKPSGIAVHGGSGMSFGVIEALRALRPSARYLELVHRLDRETSGCLLVAKKRSLLRTLHELLRRHQIDKRYLVLVKGRWRGGMRRVDSALKKTGTLAGERFVRPNVEGKAALTELRPFDVGPLASLLEARTLTGRTHQIRVHAASLGHPIAGDLKYGDPSFNRDMRAVGLKRLFLHAASIAWREAPGVSPFRVEAPLDESLGRVLEGLGLRP